MSPLVLLTIKGPIQFENVVIRVGGCGGKSSSEIFRVLELLAEKRRADDCAAFRDDAAVRLVGEILLERSWSPQRGTG